MKGKYRAVEVSAPGNLRVVERSIPDPGASQVRIRVEACAFSVLENVRPIIETFPLEQAADSYARMIQGKARFRVVLATKDGVA